MTAFTPTRAARPRRLTVVRQPGGIALRLTRPRASAVLRPRDAAVCAALGMAALVALAVDVSIGDYAIPLTEVAGVLLGAGSEDTRFIVVDLRLPRALTGLLVGAAFGLSGAIVQALARNPLASPDVIGITAGASTAAVAVIVLGGSGWLGGLGTTGAALLGGFTAALAVYLLAWRRGVHGYRLVLVGIGMAAVLTSVTSYLLVRAELTDAQRATVWLTGSLNGRGWEHVRPVAAALVVLVPLALLLGQRLAALQFGDDTAKGLGIAVERNRLALISVGVALAGIATASAGPVAFVALVAPQIARRLTRSPGVPLLCSAVTGAFVVVASDVVARRALAPTELPVGVVTAIIGAPFLLWLLARTNRLGNGG